MRRDALNQEIDWHRLWGTTERARCTLQRQESCRAVLHIHRWKRVFRLRHLNLSIVASTRTSSSSLQSISNKPRVWSFILPSGLNGLLISIPLLFKSHLIDPLIPDLRMPYLTLSFTKNLFSLVSSSSGIHESGRKLVLRSSPKIFASDLSFFVFDFAISPSLYGFATVTWQFGRAESWS